MVPPVKPLDGEFSPITTSPNTSGSYMRDTSISTSTVQSPSTPIHSRYTTMYGHTSSQVNSRSRPDISAHTRSSSQLPLLSSINSPPVPVTDPVGMANVDVPQVEEPLYNPYELLPAVPPSMAVTKLPAPVSTQAGTSTVIELGPNGYPIEKRREFRMEPEKKRLYPANPDMVGSSSGGGDALKEGPSASPPAYDT